MSDEVSNIENQFFGFLPADAGVGNGLAVDVLTDFLAAVFQVAFDHEALEHTLDVAVVAAGVEDVFADPGLLVVLLGRVGMVGIHNEGDVFQASGGVGIIEIFQVFKMIVGMAWPCLFT